MNPQKLKLARQKAHEAKRRKRAGLTDEEKEAERPKGKGPHASAKSHNE